MLSSIDKLTIALCSCAILVALVFISEGSSVTVTYDSDKCYGYTLNAKSDCWFITKPNNFFTIWTCGTMY